MTIKRFEVECIGVGVPQDPVQILQNWAVLILLWVRPGGQKINCESWNLLQPEGKVEEKFKAGFHNLSKDGKQLDFDARDVQRVDLQRAQILHMSTPSKVNHFFLDILNKILLRNV